MRPLFTVSAAPHRCNSVALAVLPTVVDVVVERRCNRCEVESSMRGGMRATVAGEDGRPRKKFICRACLHDLQGAWDALFRHAEVLERRAA